MLIFVVGDFCRVQPVAPELFAVGRLRLRQMKSFDEMHFDGFVPDPRPSLVTDDREAHAKSEKTA